MSDEELLEFMEEEGGGGPTKTLIIDISNNWGQSVIGFRELDLTIGGVTVPMNSTLAAFYATTTNGGNVIDLSFDTSLSKIGTFSGTSWLATADTNQRMIAVYNTEPTYDGITVYNFHNAGGLTGFGIKDIKIYTSPDIITNTAFGSELSGTTLIFDGQIAEHTLVDEADPQVLTLI